MMININAIWVIGIMFYSITVTILFVIAAMSRGRQDNDYIMQCSLHNAQLEHFIHIANLSREQSELLQKKCDSLQRTIVLLRTSPNTPEDAA